MTLIGRNVYAAALLVGCAGRQTGVDATYERILNLGEISFQVPSCFDTGDLVQQEEQTPLGFSGLDAARPIVGEHRVAVQWPASQWTHVHALLENVSQLEVEGTLDPDTPIEVVPRLTRRGKQVCEYRDGYLRFPVILTVTAPGLFSLMGTERVYVGSVDVSDPRGWMFEASVDSWPLSGAPSAELRSAIESDAVTGSEPVPDELSARYGPEGLRLRLGSHPLTTGRLASPESPN